MFLRYCTRTNTYVQPYQYNTYLCKIIVESIQQTNAYICICKCELAKVMNKEATKRRKPRSNKSGIQLYSKVIKKLFKLICADVYICIYDTHVYIHS